MQVRLVDFFALKESSKSIELDEKTRGVRKKFNEKNGSWFFLKIKVNRKYQKKALNQQPYLHKSRDLDENNQELVDDKVTTSQ